MKRLEFYKYCRLVLVGTMVGLSFFQVSAATRAMTADELAGKKYFEGFSTFKNNGPSCISCHSVKNDNVVAGGLLAKDLTDVYTRLGVGISAWLAAPSFPAMAASYQNNPLTENERVKLQAFFKYTNDVKASQSPKSKWDSMVIGGGLGVLGLLLLINIIWFTRKKKMVKKEIFERQSKAWDAKF